jgi:hypothetical protein
MRETEWRARVLKNAEAIYKILKERETMDAEKEGEEEETIGSKKGSEENRGERYENGGQEEAGRSERVEEMEE